MRLETGEADALRSVARRLRAAYADRHDPGTVDAVLAAAVEDFAQARIRDFVPVLAERRARAALDADCPGSAGGCPGRDEESAAADRRRR